MIPPKIAAVYSIGDFFLVEVKQDAQVRILTLQGRIVLRQKVNAGSHKVKLALAPGIYVVKLALPGYAVYEKIEVRR